MRDSTLDSRLSSGSVPDSPESSPVAERAFQALGRLISQWDTAELESFSRLDDAHMLTEIVRRGLLLNVSDAKERLLIKGADRFASLVNRHGGWMDKDELASALNISVEALNKRIQRGSYVTVANGKRVKIPVFQFVPQTQKVWPEIEALCKNRIDDAKEGIVRFLLSRIDPGQSDATPLSLVEGGQIDSDQLKALYLNRFSHGS